ncbi:uncharacterized protein [Littorina saxatilis]|uniref:uncharacterized protein n=1 Tax=Littorina saxatilis TaxID=31220 RepID=UPI0038B4B77E
MVDTDLLHKTLTELVDYYKVNDIVTTGSAANNFGKLSEPCPKEPYVHWFSETLTIDEERKILQSRRKRPGSFLVSKDVTIPNKYVLAVYFADEIKRFTVTEESNRFKLRYGEMLFYSWYELVDYYREHDIEIRGNNFGKLSTPLRKEPEESCYIGRKTRMEERDLLLAGTPASGDFLIRDGITDPEAYVLAVNVQGQINHFDIYRENGGFRFCDTGKLCTTLGELVDFYKNTEITVGELSFGKLVREVGR